MNLTQKVQTNLRQSLTLEDLLPTQMPIYVNSVVYLLGVFTLSALGLLVLTGVVMAAFGPNWYHISRVGHFINSLHFWSVQLFFGGIVLHLASKYLMAAWRDGRWKTWIVGMITFFVALFTGLTGFLAQSNWDAQWIAVQSKDAMNAAGAGAFFNPMDSGQVLTLHVVVLPLLIGGLVALHLFLVRRDSPVKPLPAERKAPNE